MTEELWRYTACDLAQRIRNGQNTSREVVESHLARINSVNQSVNAITSVLTDSALAAADRADATRPIGPLHGVPFTIKDNIDLTGSPTTNGMPAFAQALPALDAPVVARMKAAGAIPLARTNMPEMGLRISTDNPLHGPTRNAWNPALTCGGSSGGEGVALATGMSPIGLGNDIGGSVRNPAYCSGVASLKPTPGRIPSAHCAPFEDSGLAFQLMAVEGPMARSIADLRVALTVLAGRDSRDPLSVDAPLTGPEPARQRAALVTELPGAPLPNSTIAAIRRAGDALAAAGFDIVETPPPEIERVHDVWGKVLTLDLATTLSDMAPITSDSLMVSLRNLVERLQPHAVPVPTVHMDRLRLCRLWSAFFADYPVVIGPVWAREPFAVDEDLDGMHGVDVILDTLRFISPGNVLGLPAVVVPTGIDNELARSTSGLPTAVQIYADRWREDLCLSAGAIIEAALPALCPINPVDQPA